MASPASPRHEWQPNSKTAPAIGVAVAKLPSDPALAERQMKAEEVNSPVYAAPFATYIVRILSTQRAAVRVS